MADIKKVKLSPIRTLPLGTNAGTRVFVVSGILDGNNHEHFGGVTGMLINTGDATKTVEGVPRMTHFARTRFRGRDKPNKTKMRWSISFRIGAAHEGEYRLTIRGHRHGNTINHDYPSNITIPRFTLQPAVKADDATKPTVEIDIIEPAAGERPEEETAMFLAIGDVTNNHELLTAKMGDVEAYYVATDGGVWVALFPPLEPGVYTLRVTDSGNHTDEREYELV